MTSDAVDPARQGSWAALRPSDRDGELGMVRVRHGKGDRARTVAIDPSAQAYVERWIAMRQALGLKGEAAALLHYHEERQVRGRPRLLLRAAAAPEACRPGRHRISSSSARSSPCAGPRGEDVADDQRPARTLIDSCDRPLPAEDRPDRARRDTSTGDASLRVFFQQRLASDTNTDPRTPMG